MTGSSENQQKRPHVKILVLCLLCTVVYMYLYSNITLKAETISRFMSNAVDDLERWNENLKRGLYQLKQPSIDNTNNQSTESTENNIINKETTSSTLLTIFTTFVYSAEKEVCRNNTLRNWNSFGPLVKPVFFSDDINLLNSVKLKGWEVMTPSKMAVGIPVLKYMYLDSMKKFRSKFYAYTNGDLLFTQNLIDTLRHISVSTKINQTHPMLIVGQRTNVKNVTVEQASTHENVEKTAKTGKLFTAWGEDYFITNSNYPWEDCPEVVVGRVAYDNWLVLNANRRRHTTIDATRTLLALHQTTKKGNSEGHSHPNRNFNGNLLGKLYKRVNYGAGLTSCTRKFTVYNTSSHQIELKDRKGC